MTRKERDEMRRLASKLGFVITGITGARDEQGNPLWLMRKRSVKYKHMSNGYQTKVLGDVVLDNASMATIMNYLNQQV